MKKSMLSIVAGSMLLAGAGVASAQSETPSDPTWNSNEGDMMTQYSTTKHYSSFMDPNLKPVIGMELPGTVTVYELPDSMKVQSSSRYRYGMVNNHPVVIETTSRKIVHAWD